MSANGVTVVVACVGASWVVASSAKCRNNAEFRSSATMVGPVDNGHQNAGCQIHSCRLSRNARDLGTGDKLRCADSASSSACLLRLGLRFRGLVFMNSLFQLT